MSKEKQILEMTNDLCDIECKGMKCKVCDNGCEYRMLSEALYNEGYRKQSEGEWQGNGYLQNCSKCGNVVNFNEVSKWLYNFCPNCGAKMKGGAEE